MNKQVTGVRCCSDLMTKKLVVKKIIISSTASDAEKWKKCKICWILQQIYFPYSQRFRIIIFLHFTNSARPEQISLYAGFCFQLFVRSPHSGTTTRRAHMPRSSNHTHLTVRLNVIYLFSMKRGQFFWNKSCSLRKMYFFGSNFRIKYN